jgi:hypothetical protein
MVDTPIVSESLQKEFRDNFPSQVSSGRDLHVSDVVVPIVDFSSTAGVSGLSVSLQQAYDFNSSNFNIVGTGTGTPATTTLTSTPGFYRVIWNGRLENQLNNSSTKALEIFLDSGLATKTIWSMFTINSGSGQPSTYFGDTIVFLKTGISLKGYSYAGRANLNVTIRQVADISGTLQNPDGYTGS